MIDTQKLRQRILDLAIRGKLVAQDPNDEPASVLLERIRTEKERLIAEGKIKRPKKAKASSSESHYQKLPEGWIKISLMEIALFGGGKTPLTDNKAFWDNGTINWVTSKDVKVPVIFESKLKLTSLGASQNVLYAPGTLLMVTRSGILRRTLPIALLGKESTVNQDIKTISIPVPEVAEYLYWYFSANEALILSQYQKDGTTVESIDFEKFQQIEILLPPLKEQLRIISKINELMILVDTISAAGNVISDNIAMTKSKILELAMQGKLVPQNPADEPAADMLRRINPKARIITDNPHYPQLPDNWALTDIRSIAKCYQPQTISTSQMNDNGDYPVYGANGIIGRFCNYNHEANELLLTCRGATCGSVNVTKERCWVNGNAMVIHVLSPDYISAKFVEYFFSLEGKSDELITGSAQPQITRQSLEPYIIPIPPISEQKRIVVMLKDLFNLLNQVQKLLAN